MEKSDHPARSSDSEVWQRALEVAKKEPRDVLVYNVESVLSELRAARNHRGRPVPKVLQSLLP